MNKRRLVIDLQYFPVVDYFSTLINSSHIVFDEYLPFRKMSFRNRTIISGANGTINLTIPVIGGRDVKARMSEIKIDNSQNWNIRHLRSIGSSYNRSPYFEFFKDDLTRLFNTKPETLQEWNLACLDWVIRNCGLKIQYEVANEKLQVGENSLTADYRDQFVPRLMQTKRTDVLPYRQVFEEKFGFIPHLSILDFLFCNGPAAVRNLANESSGISSRLI